MMMMSITTFGTRVHSDINVQPLHLTPVPFALPKGLSGVKGEWKPGLPLSQQHYFLHQEAASRLVALLLPRVHVKFVVLVAAKT